MAIVTQGFRLNNLPSYTPVDPSLVAFNPAAAAQGVGTAFSLAHLLEQVKAQRQKRQLMDAVMQGQIEAENARNEATVTTAMPEARDTLGKLAFNEKVRPLQFGALEQTLPYEAEKAKKERELLDPEFKFKTAKLGSDLRLLEPTEAAKVAELASSKAQSESALNLNALTENTAAAKMNALQKDLEDANLTRQSRIDRAQAENALAIKKAKNDTELLEAATKLKQEKDRAEIDYLKAHAKYFEQGGTAKAEKDPMQQVAALELAAARLNDKHGLPAYETATYDQNGKVKSTWLGLGSMQKDEAKEAAIRQRNLYREAANKIITNWAKKIGADEGLNLDAAKPNPGNGAGGGPQVGAVVNGFRFKGGNPKSPQNWEKLSPTK